ncbi:metal-dependent transcriptional regulator [Marinilongibacter aquaticus]|nr:metal-dependent transcriptional regulator [Marinilongibacter aquaticus]
MVSYTEENYLKAIYHLYTQNEGQAVSTNDLAESTQTRAASVTDMLKKLAEKKYINYKKYQGVTLTEEGTRIALRIIRKHRLWEVFLVEKLGFKWDEIHEIAEQLEHIKSSELTNRLEAYLNYPKFDPHGDPIPDAEGQVPKIETKPLSECQTDEKLTITGVSEDSSTFLRHLDKLGIQLGLDFAINDISDFDQSIEIELSNGKTLRLSHEVAKNIQASAKN